jgi:REP element-mobilizing transposase RayT
MADFDHRPIYTAENTKFAFQLRWGVTLFWATPVDECKWLNPLRSAMEADKIRFLSWRWLTPDSTQIVVSSTPSSSPCFIIQRLKGRLQYVIREHAKKALRLHYSIRSFGTQERNIVEQYVEGQSKHHLMATSKSQSIFEDLNYQDSAVDLAQMRTTSHGSYWYNLHVVIVHAERWCDVNRSRLERVKRVILQSGKQKTWRISKFAILADHIHIALGCNFEDTPESVVLSHMNNVAWIYEMTPILQFSAYVGTFSEYDQRVILGGRLF